MRRTVAAIAGDFGPAYMRRQTAAEEPPTELWEALASRGFLGVNLPERYGGGGLGMSALAAVAEEISAAGCSLLLIVVSPAIVGSILVRHGTEEQREQWLPGIAAGTTRVAFAITEPDAGSNSHDIATKATREGNGYRLKGTKYFISGHDEAENVLVVANSGAAAEGGRSRLSLFVVPTKTEGLTATRIPVEIQSPEKQFTLFFDDVFVEADRLIGEEGSGLKQEAVGYRLSALGKDRG